MSTPVDIPIHRGRVWRWTLTRRDQLDGPPVDWPTDGPYTALLEAGAWTTPVTVDVDGPTLHITIPDDTTIPADTRTVTLTVDYTDPVDGAVVIIPATRIEVRP